ncbi:MAG TPA: hypothetical protein DF383_13865, partial [Deltaproteobacteria bacterium]|nr:hypothetical protein [Deltaproteobacteria bacterium]
CGWFFDEPSGLETTQILKYARYGLELARRLDAPDLEKSFLKKLAEGKSNLPDYGSLREIFQKA